jgi:plasmid stabilization system protein ParE
MAYRLLPQARQEQRAIVRWRAEHAGVQSARELFEQLRSTYERIGGPLPPGRPRPEWLDPKYRFVYAEPYWVIWREQPGTTIRIIVKIIDARRDIASHLKGFDL